MKLASYCFVLPNFSRTEPVVKIVEFGDFEGGF